MNYCEPLLNVLLGASSATLLSACIHAIHHCTTIVTHAPEPIGVHYPLFRLW